MLLQIPRCQKCAEPMKLETLNVSTMDKQRLYLRWACWCEFPAFFRSLDWEKMTDV